MVISEGESRFDRKPGWDEVGRSFGQITVGEKKIEIGGEKTRKGWLRGKAVSRCAGISMLRGMCNPSITSVNRDRAAAGLQVYRTDNADRSIGFSEMQRRR